MERHPQLIEKDKEDDSPFWNAIRDYVTPYIENGEDVKSFILQIENKDISDIRPAELQLFYNKINDIYGGQAKPETIYYNIFLGRANYEKIIKKISDLKNIKK